MASNKNASRALEWTSLICGAAGWLMVLSGPWWWIGFACVVIAVATGSAGLRRKEAAHQLCMVGLLSAICACVTSFLLLRTG